MIAVLHGNDEFRRSEALDRLRESLDGEGLEENTERIDGRTAQPDELLARCQTVPFLASKRLIVVDGLLGRFNLNTPRRRNQPRKRASPALGPWQTFIEGLSALPDTTVLVFVDEEVTAGNPWLDELTTLRPPPRVQEFKPKRPAEVAGWINTHATALGVRLEARATVALAQLAGNNLRLIDSELRKLATYAGDQPVSGDDVVALVSFAREASVFTMVDAVAEGRAKDAIVEYRRLLDKGEPPQRLLAMVARQFRLLVHAKDLRERGVAPAEMAARLRVANFTAQKVQQQMSAFRTERLREAYRMLVETDLSIKRGIYDDETAIELLLYELCGLRGPTGRQQPAPARGRQGYSTPRAVPDSPR